MLIHIFQSRKIEYNLRYSFKKNIISHLIKFSNFLTAVDLWLIVTYFYFVINFKTKVLTKFI